MDYFHYAYQCPYHSGTKDRTVYCEDGCKITFPTVASCRKFLCQYCANEDQAWQKCTIAQAKTDYIDDKIQKRKDIKAWMRLQEERMKGTGKL